MKKPPLMGHLRPSRSAQKRAIVFTPLATLHGNDTLVGKVSNADMQITYRLKLADGYCARSSFVRKIDSLRMKGAANKTNGSIATQEIGQDSSQ